MSLYIIHAFVRMREQQAANAAILKRLAEIDKTLLIHDARPARHLPKAGPVTRTAACATQTRNRLSCETKRHAVSCEKKPRNDHEIVENTSTMPQAKAQCLKAKRHKGSTTLKRCRANSGYCDTAR